MTFVLRRCFWMVDLGFVAAAATLCALLVGALLPHTARIPEISLGFSGAAPVAKTALDPKAASQVLGLPLDGTEPINVEPEPVGPVPSTLSVKLLGTSVSNIPELSLASIQDLSAKETSVFAVGDLVQGATITDIERLRVTVDNHGRREVIDLEQTVAVPSPAPLPPTGAGPAPALGVISTGPGKYRVPRADVQRIIPNPLLAFPGVFVAPAIDGGVTKGWKFSRVPADSLLGKLGIAQGDVVRRIDGYEMTDLSKLMEVLGRLPTATQIGVEIERNGASQRLEYRLTD